MDTLGCKPFVFNMPSSESCSDQKQFSITTPLYYVNGLPHVGSAYTTMAADVLARFQRLRGYDVLLITGTDEHGQKIQRTAENLNRSPQKHCDEMVAGFQDLWQRLEIQYNRFSRTTSDRHTAIVKEFFQRVWDQGDIYLDQQQGWYCVDCEEFKEERDLLPGRLCPTHIHRPVEWRDEENYFFRLSRYQQKLLSYYEAHPQFIQPDIRRNEVLSFAEQGLKDFSISRINLDWGIPFPGNPKHTLYVWFDALLGYVTALLEPDVEPTLENALAKWWPIDLHLIGKDILRFHAIYWPAMLFSAELPLPGAIFGHGFLTKDGQKMGKSLGNTLDPFDLVEQYGSDAVRYYFLKEIDFGRDGDFTETRFVNILNADLADTFGNLLNRTLKMALKYWDGKVPEVPVEGMAEGCLPVVHLAQQAGGQVTQAYEALNFSGACEVILTLVRAGNKLIDEQAPWSRYKEGDFDGVNQTLYAVLESVRISAYLLAPVIPGLSSKIYCQLGYPIDFNDLDEVARVFDYATHSQWGVLPAQQVLGVPEPIFQKLSILEPELV